MKICILDYGVGNLFSVEKACRQFTNDVFVQEDSVDIEACDALILPGVGSFKAGMDGLKIRGLTEAVHKHVNVDKPLLGICLGAQLLLSKGEEFGEHEGLNIIPGKVTHFPTLVGGCKIPHIGWNAIDPPQSDTWKNTIFDTMQPGVEMYFVHSYILHPQNSENVLAHTQYGGCTFASAIRKGNVYGCQFHPEKSATDGLQIIEQFLNMVST